MTMSLENNGVFGPDDEAIRFRFDTNQYFLKSKGDSVDVYVKNHDKTIYEGELEIEKDGA